MFNKTIVIVGALEEYSTEIRGDKGFRISRIKVGQGERFFELEATGDIANQIDLIAGVTPVGTRVRVPATVNLRRWEDTALTSLVATGFAPDFGGSNTSGGFITGVVSGVREAEGRNGTFKIPLLDIVAADRDGILPFETSKIELNAPRDGKDQFLADWEANIGKYAEVQFDLGARITSTGRSRPQFYVTKVTFHDMPSYLNELVGNEGGAGNLQFADAPVDGELADAI